MPRLLLVNPYIEDFAAYDHFAKPLGLLQLAAQLSPHNEVRFLNALNRQHPANRRKIKANGTGKFPSRKIASPEAIVDIPRQFQRFGIPEEVFLAALQSLEQPDYILLTSGMTYWYTGLVYTISLIRRIFPEAPILVGGIYVNLLPEHAKKLPGVNAVIPRQDLEEVLTILAHDFGIPADRTRRIPAYHLLEEQTYMPLLTGSGCPFRCSYCAGHRLCRFQQFPVEYNWQTVKYLAEQGIRHFAFYDDALLFAAEEHLIPLLEKIIAAGLELNIYTPNGLHIRYLDRALASLMRTAGFRDIRISLESIDPDFQKEHGAKTGFEDFRRAAAALHAAGYPAHTIQAYTLANVPGQDPASIESTMRFIAGEGVQPRLAFYSPIPGTPDFDKLSPDLRLAEPLNQNNTVHLYRSGFDHDYYQYLKNLEHEYRRAFAYQ